jgi:hypothetical protein
VSASRHRDDAAARALEAQQVADEAAAAAREAAATAAATRTQQLQHRDALQRQLDDRRARAEAEVEEKRRIEREEAQRVNAERKVLYRCPVSGRLLPPSAFNMTSQVTPASGRHSVAGAI